MVERTNQGDDPAALCASLNVAARLLSATVARRLAPLGFAPGQIATVLALQEHGELSQADLARLVGVEQPTMAATLTRMERDGLLARSPDPTDARRSLLRLTPLARRRLPAVQRARLAAHEEALAGLSERERAQLERLVGRVVENLGRGG
jgi:MarR family transcriptional regulator, transcriptional regulator for hemolysin